MLRSSFGILKSQEHIKYYYSLNKTNNLLGSKMKLQTIDKIDFK